MDLVIKNEFASAHELNKKVIAEPFDTFEFIERLKSATHTLYGSSKQLKSVLNSIELLERYCLLNQIKTVVPDEEFFLKVTAAFKKGEIRNGTRSYGSTTIQAVSQDAKRILNRCFLPQGWIQRKVLDERLYRRYRKFLSLTPDSQKMIVWFEKAAKKLKSDDLMVINERKELVRQGRRFQFGSGLLTPALRRYRIDVAILFLSVVGKNGFEFVTEADIETFREFYQAKKKAQAADKYLRQLASFFWNCYLGGFLKENVFQGLRVANVKERARVDFINEDGIAKLLDLKTVNWGSPLAVRNRLICLLGYDCGFRRGELVQLPLDCIEEMDAGLVRIRVDSLIQKGEKSETYLYLLFQETAQLLRRYMHARC